MVTTVTSGTYVYEVVEDWAKLPEGWSFVEVAGVGVDSKDRVYVFNRGEHPMMVFDRDGNFLQSWGEGVFQRPHAVTMGPRRHHLLHRRHGSLRPEVYPRW